jgi:hypothetical protein
MSGPRSSLTQQIIQERTWTNPARADYTEADESYSHYDIESFLLRMLGTCPGWRHKWPGRQRYYQALMFFVCSMALVMPVDAAT